MANERYIVELILKARDDTRDAFRKVINDQEALNKVLNQAQQDYDAVGKSVQELKSIEKDYYLEKERLNKQKSEDNKLSSETIHLQVALNNATERYVKTIHDSSRSYEEKRAAFESMTEAANALTNAENDLRGADEALAEADVELLRQRQLGIAQSRELAIQAGNEVKAKQAVLDALEEEGKLRKQLGSIESEEFAASEQRIENIIKNNESLRISQEEITEAINRGQKIRKEDVDRFAKDTKRLIDAQKAVIDIDKELSDPKVRAEPVVRTRLELDRASLIQEIEDLETSLSDRQRITQQLDLEIDNASVAKLEASVQLLKQALGFKVPVEFDIDNASLARTASIMQVLNGAYNAFSDGADKASKRVAAFDNIVRGLLILGIAVFLQQLALGAVAAAGALSGLVSSAIAAGGAIGGALTAGIAQALPALGVFATFLNRFRAITQAVKQQNLQQQQASYQGGQAAQSQANSLDQVVAAQERVKEAQDRVTEARIKARETLEDLILAEQKQTLGLEKAKENLNEAISSGGSFAVAQAQIGVSEAGNQLGRTRRDLTSRTRQGIERSPEVTEAKKQLEEAKKALAQAKTASDQAGQGVSAAAGKLDFLIGNLSDAEQKLFDALVELQKRWQNFAQQITGPLTNAFTFAVRRITRLLGSDELLEVGKSTSRALGESFRQVFDAILSPEILGRVLNLAKEFETNLRPLTQIAITLSRVFLDIAEAGAPALRVILDYVNELVQKLGSFTGSEGGKNALTEFFDLGAQSLIKFVDLFLSVGNVILALIDPKGGGGIAAGNTILDQLTGSFNRLAEAIRTPGTRANEFFRRFFNFGTQVLPLLKPLLLAIADLIDQLFTPQGLQSVRNFVTFLTRVVVPAFGFFLKTITTLTDSVVKLIESFRPFEAFVQFIVGIALVGSVFGRIVAILAPLTNTVGFLISAASKTTIFGKMLMELTDLIPLLNRFKTVRQTIETTEKNIAAAQAAQSAVERRRVASAGTSVGAGAGAVAAGAVGEQLILDGLGGSGDDEDRDGRRRRGGRLRGAAGRIPVVGRLFGGGAGGAAQGAAGFARGGPIAIGILAIVAAITALLAAGGKLDEVLKAISDVFKATFSAAKDAVQELVKEITGEASLKKGLKEIATAISDVLIPAIRIFGTIIGGAFVGGIKIVTAFVRFVRRAFSGFNRIVEGLFEFDGDKILSGLQQLLGAFAELLLSILTKPFEGIAAVARNLFKDVGSSIESTFVNVINFIIRGINKAIDLINRIPGVDIEKVEEVQSPEQRRRADRQTRRQATRDLAGAEGPSTRRILQQSRDTRQSRREQRAAGRDPLSTGGRGGGGAASQGDRNNAEKFLEAFNPETVKLSEEITKRLSRYWRTLRREARGAVEYVKSKTGEIRKDGGRDIDKFVTAAQSDLGRMRRSFRSNFVGIANIVRNQMVNVSNIVANQMQNSAMAVYKGAKYMRDTLNDALDAVGAKEIELSIKVPKIRDEKASGGFVGRANGGWIGNRGERGRDAVPALLGRGEAVLNWGQQKVVEPALRQTYGFGLDEMFNRTQGYHAGGPSNSPGYARGKRGARDGIYTASVFNDRQGYKGDLLGSKPYNWAELGVSGGVGNAFGGLPYKTQIKVSYKGRSVNLSKLDIGSGGPGLGGKIRAVDIWQTPANKLRLPGLANVFVSFTGKTGDSGTGGARAAEEIAMPKIMGGSRAMRNLVGKGLEKFRSAANKKIERETPVDVTGSGGDLSVPRGTASPNLREAIAMGKRMGLVLSSFLRPGDLDSFHSQGRAADLSGSPAAMARFFRWALKRYGRRLTELFYDPLGGIDNGISIGKIGNHMDHVHIAFNRGGRITEELLREREKKARKKLKMGGMKQYAAGGAIDGPDGQAVPIMAHAGEWVLNKRQQNMVAGIAGTTADRLKGMLGFSGGPTSFQGGGVPRAFRREALEIPAGLLQTFTSFGTFDKELTKAIAFIGRAAKDVLSSQRLKRQIEKTEKQIADLKKGGESDKDKKEIEAAEKLLKDLRARKDFTTLLTSVRQLTGTDGEGGALSAYAERIKKQFDDVIAVTRLGGAGFARVGNVLRRIVDPKAFKDAVDPVKIAELEEKAQADLVNRLIDLRNRYQETFTNLEKASKKLPSSARLASQIRRIDKTIERLEERDGKNDKERIKKLEERKKRLEGNQKIRQQIDGELNTLREQILEKENEIIEAEQARLEAQQKAFEETTKQQTRSVDQGDAFNNLVKSIGEITGNSGFVTGALNTAFANAQERKRILEQRLAEAQQKAASDPRWQQIVDDLGQQLLDANLAVVQTQADIIENSISSIETAFQRSETARGLNERLAAISERITTGGGNDRRRANLEGRGRDLVTQRDALSALLSDPNIQGNAKQLQDLRDKIEELNVAIQENTQEIADFNLQLRQQAVERITGISNRTGGLLGNVGSIFDNIARGFGQPNTRGQISIAESLRTALGLERTNLAEELASFLADPNSGGLLGPEAGGVLQQLLASFSSGDPNSFASTLQALAPQIALLEASLGESARGPFSAFIESLTNNTIAITDNTANLAELNGLANQPQPFSTTSWTRFRAAIFNGIGDVLPQFQVPAMATGGYITKGGLFELHPGEFVINASQNNIPSSDGDINITVNEANKPLDVTALASRIAFEKRTRK